MRLPCNGNWLTRIRTRGLCKYSYSADYHWAINQLSIFWGIDKTHRNNWIQGSIVKIGQLNRHNNLLDDSF